jgi:hypothetical protein
MNPQFHIFSSLQTLLSKVSYETFCHQHCKKRSNCPNSILGSPKIVFFFKKTKKAKNKKRIVTWKSKGQIRVLSTWKYQTEILNKI